MAYRVFIDGQEGTTGLRIWERLSARTDIRLLEIDPACRKDSEARLALFAEADIVFLCLPDESAAEIVRLADEAGGAASETRIIDAATVHRVRADWVYGLPELPLAAPTGGERSEMAAAPIVASASPNAKQRDLIRNTRRCAVPGCHATGYILAVRPLVDAGLIAKDVPPAVHSLTGYSGGGKKMIADYEAQAGRRNAPRLYALTQSHKHLPEMVHMTRLLAPPAFVPIVDRYYSGMLVSIPLPQGAGGLSRKDVRDVYRRCYGGEPLIHVRELDADPEDGFLAADAMAGRDDLELFVLGNDERVTVAIRYDNLGKGASGAAIQCLNLMLGMEETTGLMIERKTEE